MAQKPWCVPYRGPTVPMHPYWHDTHLIWANWDWGAFTMLRKCIQSGCGVSLKPKWVVYYLIAALHDSSRLVDVCFEYTGVLSTAPVSFVCVNICVLRGSLCFTAFHEWMCIKRVICSTVVGVTQRGLTTVDTGHAQTSLGYLKRSYRATRLCV